MPPLAIPPIVAVATLTAALAARWIAREYQRVNAELDALKAARAPVDRSHLQTLRRDPVSGEYRLP
jgi:hypothetical protein